jgi:predicted metal-binding membrane protein
LAKRQRLPDAAADVLQLGFSEHSAVWPGHDATRRIGLVPSLLVNVYVFGETLFGAATTMVQLRMSESHQLMPMMEPAMPVRAGGLLLGQVCISSCHLSECVCRLAARLQPALVAGPQGYLERSATVRSTGFSCLGCCWVLMLLLFADSVMNLAVIGALTLFVLFEKIAPFGVRSTLVGRAPRFHPTPAHRPPSRSAKWRCRLTFLPPNLSI